MADKDVPGLYDEALEAVGLTPRKKGEAPKEYRDRVAKGPNGAYQLDRLEEHAAKGDRDRTFHAAHSAREHIDNPNPPDTHPRQA